MEQLGTNQSPQGNISKQETRNIQEYLNFLVERVKELEETLELSNNNCLEMKENLEYVIQREKKIKSEFVIYSQESEENKRRMNVKFQEYEIELEKKKKVIDELED